MFRKVFNGKKRKKKKKEVSLSFSIGFGLYKYATRFYFIYLLNESTEMESNTKISKNMREDILFHMNLIIISHWKKI